MSEPLLRARALTKTYTMGKRSLEVLRGVDLDVARGEFLALRGASGAGKSTLLHLIGGLDLPNAGEILFDGNNLVAFSERRLTEFRNRRVGFIFQAYHLLPELTALENVCLPARMARISSATVEVRGRELLARVGLKDRLDHKPSELSGGEQQRVAIARALINEPELFSPTSRRAIWIPRPAAKSLNCSKAYASKKTRRSSSPRTTRRSPRTRSA
jgi:ABC-type lipoprotein export system ATPase subunit